MKSTIQSVSQYIVKNAKTALNIIIVGAVATAAFKLGAKYGNATPATKPNNPYAHAFSPKEISIAVNESRELIMIERATGDYIVYSDTIGQTIFNMYAARIHQEVTNGK